MDTVSHLVLQVYLRPTGEKKLNHINVTTLTGTHEGSEAILRNTVRQNSTSHGWMVMDKKPLVNHVRHYSKTSLSGSTVKYLIFLGLSVCVKQYFNLHIYCLMNNHSGV